MGISLVDLAPDGYSPRPPGDHFWAYCPNPLCEENEAGIGRDCEPYVTWKSGKNYLSDQFDDVNFCESCGRELAKECPSCKKPLEKANAKFCKKCGARICTEITEDEWNLIRHFHSKSPKKEPQEEEIPF
jgi:hypothetical protein